MVDAEPRFAFAVDGIAGDLDAFAARGRSDDGLLLPVDRRFRADVGAVRIDGRHWRRGRRRRERPPDQHPDDERREADESTDEDALLVRGRGDRVDIVPAG